MDVEHIYFENLGITMHIMGSWYKTRTEDLRTFYFFEQEIKEPIRKKIYRTDIYTLFLYILFCLLMYLKLTFINSLFLVIVIILNIIKTHLKLYINYSLNLS